MTTLLIKQRVAPGESIHIGGEERHYLCNVRRHQVGDKVTVHSPGGKYATTVTRIDNQQAELLIESQLEQSEEPWPVHLLVAVPKGTLFDDVVRKANEMGVSRITPVITERSVVFPKAAKLDRWRRIAMQSIRQCERSTPIVVDDITKFDQALEGISQEGVHYILHPYGDTVPIGQLLKREFDGPIVMAIGPEGGFTDGEVAKAKDFGFISVKFGKYILRVETAALMAASLSISFVGGLD